jgi:ubiquinone/menaquinone biosynthesis C-methylase UbiE
MKANLSDQEFFSLYVKDNSWYPLQNHGLIDEEILLDKEDLDFPNQITAYLNLFKNIKPYKKSILDLGCGWGRGTYTINKYFNKCDVIGIDINNTYIEYAKSNFKGCYYFKDDFFKTKLKPYSFDFIISNCSMHFFYGHDIIFNNLKKVLKKDGQILITDIWTKESINIFLKKIKQHNFKLVKLEDLSEKTIKAMEEDILKVFPKFLDNIKEQSISAFLKIQDERLNLFKTDINKQYKVIIENEF